MKLWLIKQVCDILTDIQDINQLIYSIYKKHIGIYILLRFVDYYNEIIETYGLEKKMVIWSTIIYKNNHFIYSADINCWFKHHTYDVGYMIDSNICRSGMILNTNKIGSPGICNECIRSL
jgi:hypothetical protein